MSTNKTGSKKKKITKVTRNLAGKRLKVFAVCKNFT